MGKQHPCIAWAPIFWGKCRGLSSTNKNKAKDGAESSDEEDPPTIHNLHKAKDCAEAIKEDPPTIPNLADNIITTNTLNRHRTRYYRRCALPLLKSCECIRAADKKGGPLPDDVINDILARHPCSEINEWIEAIENGIYPPSPDLPYDIITNILSRLPVKCIIQLWQQTNPNDLLRYFITGLTTNPVKKHRATPTIVVQSHKHPYCNNMELFLSDAGKAESVKATRLDLRSYCEGGKIVLYGSCDGFLLFLREFTVGILCLWNPITKEQVIVTRGNSNTRIFGFYFNPMNKEYEVICVRRVPKKWEFQILGLTTKRRRSVGSCSYCPSRIKPMPVLANGIFYWWVDGLMSIVFNGDPPSLSDSILSFDIETEEFCTIEAVKPSNHPLRPEEVFQLFELDGDLSLFDPSSRDHVAFLWVLDYPTKRWIKKHSITSPPSHENRQSFFRYFTNFQYNKMKGECIVYDRWNDSPPYVYNLLSGTWKPFDMKGFEDGLSTTIVVHTPSLVSLNAADSVIPVEW